MNNSLFLKWILVVCALGPAFLLGAAKADVLLDNTSMIGTPSVAPPAEFAFTTTVAEGLTVTLTDFQAPAAFGSLQIAVTMGDTLVGSASVDSTTHTATVAIPAGIGTYVLRVIGAPVAAQNSTLAVGSFGACVTRASDPATCIAADSFSANIQTPSTPSTTPSSALNTTFKSTVSGVYTIAITDDLFPVSLQSVSGGIASGSTPIANLAAGTNQVTLTAGMIYTLVIGALADAGAQAGLYGVHIADPSGAAIFDQTEPVGKMPAATSVNNVPAQTLGVTLNDLAYPAALARVGVAVTSGSALLGALTASGTVPLAAPAGTLQIWQYAVSNGQPGVYNLGVAPATGSSLYATTQVVNPSTTTGQSFAFVKNLTAAGTYTLAVTDFQFPSALAAAPTATVAQNGVVLPQSSSGAFTAAAGDIVVLVDAVPPPSGSGIFGVTVETSGSSPQIVFDQTQSVGGLFTTQTVNVATAGSYDVTLTDLKFPSVFQDLAVLVSQGSQVLGKIFGGGTFSMNVQPGAYTLTFVDTPSGTAGTTPGSTPNYGLYAVHVASSAPTVTFTAGVSSVTAGQPVQLTWSAQNATSCTASGSTAWSGSEKTSDTASVVISATATLTLTCDGPGGSAAQSVTITATPAPAKSGGGGSADVALLSLLGAVLIWGRRRRPQHRIEMWSN
jgi:MYXO-CTERM domain-containing protein